MAKRETRQQVHARAKKIIVLLREEYPNPQIALRYSNPLQLLIATILSAQCTDVRVNLVTPGLFKKYKTAQDFANANQNELEEDIRSTGFYKNKARNIIACCRALVGQHNGNIPATMEELIQLAGVGRKTANVVLGGAFGKRSGVVVDTHVRRLSQRLGLTDQNDPEKIERDLMEILPQKDWFSFGNLLIWHGRNVCDARKPKCPECVLKDVCPSAKLFLNKK